MEEDKQKLDGTTLKVYLLLLTSKKSMGPREVTKRLGLSSPSIAYYHLKKLEELGLVEKDQGGYRVSKKIKLNGVIVLGRMIIPRLLFYASIFTGLLIMELIVLITRIQKGETITPEYYLLILTTLFSTIILFVEGVGLYRRMVK